MPVHLTCLTCGTAFTRKPSHAAHSRFCSRICQHALSPETFDIINDGATALVPLRTHSGVVRDYALIDSSDAELIGRYRWHIARGYATRMEKGANGRQQTVRLHRDIMGLTFGDVREVDHINRNRLDNRRNNLRILPRGAGAQNRGQKRCASSAFRGVSWHKATGKWAARAKIDGRDTHLGLFTSEQAAAEAAKVARLQSQPYAID